MKKVILSVVAILAFAFATQAQGVITFKKINHDFGKVKEGDKAVYVYEFTNTGDAPIIVSNAAASCGCTTPSYTKDPVLPGKSGSITASFDSQGRPGVFNKTVTVTSNATVGSLTLSLKGDVISKPVPVGNTVKN